MYLVLLCVVCVGGGVVWVVGGRRRVGPEYYSKCTLNDTGATEIYSLSFHADFRFSSFWKGFETFCFLMCFFICFGGGVVVGGVSGGIAGIIF